MSFRCLRTGPFVFIYNLIHWFTYYVILKYRKNLYKIFKNKHLNFRNTSIGKANKNTKYYSINIFINVSNDQYFINLSMYILNTFFILGLLAVEKQTTLLVLSGVTAGLAWVCTMGRREGMKREAKGVRLSPIDFKRNIRILRHMLYSLL